MPRKNSQSWSSGDQMTATRLNDINEDIDDIYSLGTDRGRIVANAVALKIDIGAFAYRIGGSYGLYTGGTAISVTNSATNYVEIDDTGTIQINTTGWNGQYGRLGTVVCSGGVITSISIYKPDVVGGNLSGSALSRSVVTSINQTISASNGYIANKSTVATSSRARTTNVATIVTATSHGLTTGDLVVINGMSGTGYNTQDIKVSVTVTNSTTFTYSNTGTDEGTTSDTGGIIGISVAFILPSSPAVGDTFGIEGYSRGGRRLKQNASQQILVVNSLGSTAGTSGYLDSSNYTDGCLITYVGSNIFKVIEMSGYCITDTRFTNYNGTIYISTLLSSDPTTITTNMGIIQKDVLMGKYNVIVVYENSGGFGVTELGNPQSGDNNYQKQEWSATPVGAGTAGVVRRQSNSMSVGRYYPAGTDSNVTVIIKRNR